MLNIIKNTINRVFASGVDSDASAFITATGLSGTTQKSAITTLVKDLKSSGLWSKMKAVYPMVTDNYNLLSYTEDFSNAFWVKNNSTVTSNSATAPNGTLTADTLIPSAGTNVDNPVVFVLMDTASQTRTFSFYAKSAGYNYTFARVGGATPVALALFDLSNGTVVQTQSPATSASIESVGNGWYRCQMTYPNNPLYAPCIGSCSSTYTISSTGITTTTNGTSGIYIWGAQLEASSLASTYQPILNTPAAFMASQMKYNLKDARDLDAAFRLTWSGGWTYSATGATPNGTNAYADSKLVPSANLSTNNTHISSYIRNTSQGVLLGTDNAFRLWIAPNFNGTNRYAEINNGATTTPSSPISALIGLWSGSRINSSTVKLYNNSSINYSYNILSSGLDTSAIYISARNAGGASNYSSSQVAFSSIGNGLTDQDTFLLNQIVEKYQVALSRGVQAAQSFYYNSAYSNEANTYLYSTQITGTTQVSAINTLINGLKANNLWTKMKAVYPFVTDYRNLLSYTEDFSNAYWAKNSSTIVANSTNDPFGGSNADSLVDTVANTPHYVSTTNTAFGQNGNNTVSIYAKANTLNWLVLYIFDGSAAYYSYYNLSNGTIGTNASGNIASIQNAGNGWYRCILTRNYNGTATNSNAGFILANADNVITYAGTGKSVYIYGAQYELGASATTYQPILAANSSSTFMSSQMKFNLVNPQDSDAAFRLAFSGGWTYSTNGAQPNGTNGYADTKLNPSTDLTASSIHISSYLRTNSDGVFNEIGAFTANPNAAINLYPRLTNVSYNDIGLSNNGRVTYANTDSTGYYIASRTSNVLLKAYKNDTLKGSYTTTDNATFGSVRIFLSAQSANNVAAQFSNRQTAFASIGQGLNDAEAALLYQLIQQYQTDLSRQV